MRQITLKYPRKLFRLWRQYPIYQVWNWEYPGLFDEKDRSNAGNQHRGGYHFAEWFTAIHFWKKGYRVLLSKYALKSHHRKFAEARKLLGMARLAFLQEEYRPDLLVFDQDQRYFFFVEVKRERDRLRNHQIASFRAIEEQFDCPVLLVSLKGV